MAVKVETPPALTGEAEQQLRQVYSYLFRLSENLNVALNNLSGEGYASAVGIAGGAVNDGSGSNSDNGYSSEYAELRSLIINTAQIVRNEMDILETELESNYEAISAEWGAYQENVKSTITATANEVIQELEYDSRIESLEASFSEYKIHAEGYIKSGFVEYDENNVPIIGIAIGQGLTTTTVTVDGVEYEEIDPSQSCAFYTAEKVSFRVNGQEVAYVSNSKLYIRDVEIAGSIVLSSKWMITTTSGFKIKWIGG